MEKSGEYELDYWSSVSHCDTRLTAKEAQEINSELSLYDLMEVGQRLTSRQVGDVVSYAISYNINYSNYCAASCPICAFYVPIKTKGKTDRGYELSVQDVGRETEAAKKVGATEIHIVGGFNPDLSLEYYESIFSEVKKRLPGITLKALTIPEIDFISTTTKNSLREVVERFVKVGMDAHTGGGAEIFSPEIRKQITTPEKISGEKWLSDAALIHSMGIPGNSTMTYGHVEDWPQIIDHMIRIRDSQLETPGFLSFIPLKFSPENTPLLKMGKVKGPAPADKDLRVIALARIIMGMAIRNISVYWVSLGKEVAQVALGCGGSDLVGTAFSEKVFGATNRTEQTSTEELDHMIRESGRIPAVRDTLYRIVRYS